MVEESRLLREIKELIVTLDELKEVNSKLKSELDRFKERDVTKLLEKMSTWKMDTYNAETKETKTNTLISKEDLIKLMEREW